MGRIPTEMELRNLYLNKKMSLSEVAELTSLKTHKIIYWMDKYHIPRRCRSEANYIKHNPDGDPFCIKRRLTREETKLKYLALGLYWGEGGKTTPFNVKIVNSDPGVIKIFTMYLRNICNVKENKIHYYLQTFKDNDVFDAKKYWAKELSVGIEKIHTCTPLKPLGRGTYQKVCKFGVMAADVGNIYLKAYIMKELGKLGLVR